MPIGINLFNYIKRIYWDMLNSGHIYGHCSKHLELLDPPRQAVHFFLRARVLL